MDVEEIHPKKEIYMIVADIKKGKNTQKILADLNACFPKSGGKIGEDVRYYLGPVNKDIVTRGRDALEQGDAEQLGSLMIEAQRFFDMFLAPACPEELLSPNLHFVLSNPDLLPFVYGGKGVGSQGDGCVQYVTRGAEEQKKLLKKLKEMDMDPYPLVIHPGSKETNMAGKK
jgi:galactokinase